MSNAELAKDVSDHPHGGGVAGCKAGGVTPSRPEEFDAYTGSEVRSLVVRDISLTPLAKPSLRGSIAVPKAVGLSWT